MTLWTKWWWAWWANKVFDEAEDIWHSRWLLVTHLVLNWQVASLAGCVILNKILTSCGFSLFKNFMHLLKAQRVTLLAWFQNSSPSNMPSEHINRPYNVASCSSLQPLHYIHLSKHYKYPLTSFPGSLLFFFLFVFSTTKKWESGKNGEVLGSFTVWIMLIGKKGPKLNIYTRLKVNF